jgi:hypothetical protein
MFTYYLWKSYFRIYKDNIDWLILDSLVFALPFEILSDLILLPIEIIFSIILINEIKKKVINWMKKQMKI